MSNTPYKPTREELRVKKYVDAWCEGKVVKGQYGYGVWVEVFTIRELTRLLTFNYRIRLTGKQRQ